MKNTLFAIGLVILVGLPFVSDTYLGPLVVVLGLVFLGQFWLLRKQASTASNTVSKQIDGATPVLAENETLDSIETFKQDYGLMRRAFNNAPVAIIIVDESILIHDLNEAALFLTGLDYVEAIGRSPGGIFKCADVESGEICGQGENCSHCPIRSRIKETFETGKILQEKRAILRTPSTRGNIEVKWLTISTEKIIYNGQNMVVLSLTDVSNYVTVRKELSEQKKVLENFKDIHQCIIRSEDAESLLENVLSLLVLMESVRYCWACVYTRDGHLQTFFSPGKEDWDRQLKIIYTDLVKGNIPCLSVAQQSDQMCLFKPGDKLCENWDIFRVFPDQILAVSALERSDSSVGFISLVLDSAISDEHTSLITSVAKDIDLKLRFLRNNEMLESSLLKAESAVKTKQEFLSVLSHELLTPMNPIIGYSRMLVDKLTESESREYLNEILEGTDRMSSIISQMLEFLHLQNHVTQVFEEELMIFGTIQESVELFRNKIHPNIIFKVQNGGADIFPLGESELVMADRRLIKSILLKLLDNAFKFTEKGFVEFVYGFGKSSQCLEFIVRDSGIGIPKPELDSIFDEFHGIDTSTSRSSEGVGLGLSICKRYLDLVGGSIEVRSHEGRGSLFHVRLPVRRVSTRGTDSLSCIQDPTDDPILDFRALVVDDSSMNRKLLRTLLTKKGWLIEEAANGQEALNKCNSIRYNLILTDIHMPFLTGEQFVRMVRMGYGMNADTSIIGVTADSSDQLRQRATSHGFDGWVLKPVTFEQLDKEIQRTLNNRKRTTKEKTGSA